MTDTLSTPVRLAATRFEGGQAGLARALGVSAPTVNQWAKGERPVPVERCPEIERATGGYVTRRDLRPHDWWLIWPELVDTDHPAPNPERSEA